MRFPVEERGPDVDDRIARDDALLHLGPDALLNRRDELARDHATDDLVDELETAARGQRLKVDVADGIFAMAAGLLDVPAHAGGLARDGLPKRNAQSDCLDGDAVPAREPVKQQI